VERPDVKEIESQLGRLERRNLWTWALVAALLAALVVALLSIQAIGFSNETLQARGRILVIAVSGLTLLFSLYMLVKQHQIRELRGELFRAMLTQGAALAPRRSSLFEGVTTSERASTRGCSRRWPITRSAPRPSVPRCPARRRDPRAALRRPLGRDPGLVRVTASRWARHRRPRREEGRGAGAHARAGGTALPARRPARDIRSGLPPALPERVIGGSTTHRQCRAVRTRTCAWSPCSRRTSDAIQRATERRLVEELREQEDTCGSRRRWSRSGEWPARRPRRIFPTANPAAPPGFSGPSADDPMRQCARRSPTRRALRHATRQLLTFSRQQRVEARLRSQRVITKPPRCCGA
jgi:hypothetical protein